MPPPLIVLYSPSFGANRRKLEEHGIFNKTADYNRRLAALSQKAADGKAFVAGDISPTGLFLSPLGEASFEELVELVPEFLKAGVAIFGGCCGTTAEHIAALSKALRNAEPVAPAPKFADLLPASTEKLTAYLPVDARCGKVLAVTPDFADELSDALETDDVLVAVRLDTWEEVELFADCQYMISKPLCIVCDDADILEAALRAYQGRALYEGALPDTALAPLVSKYGVII